MTDQTQTTHTESQEERRARWQAANRQLQEAERELARIQAEHQRLMDLINSPDVDLETTLVRLEKLEEEEAAADRRLTTARRRIMILADATIGDALNSRGRRIAEMDEKIAAIEQKRAGLIAEMDEHQRFIDAGRERILEFDREISGLVHAKVNLEPKAQKTVSSHLWPGAEWKPPEAIVKASSWFAFVQEARAAGLAGTLVDAIINELTGEVVDCPQMRARGVRSRA